MFFEDRWIPEGVEDGFDEAMAEDMRNMLMKIPECMLLIVLTGTFEHSPVPVLNVSKLVDLLHIF